MRQCEECGKISSETNVCTNCGLVFNDHPIDYETPQKFENKFKAEKEYIRNFYHILSPDLTYMNKGDKKYYRKDTDKYRYVKAYIEISKIISQLRLSNVIKYEALNIYRCIREKKPDFFTKKDLHPSYLAFVKIAADIHGCFLHIDKYFGLGECKYNADKLYEIYKDRNTKEIRCPHCKNVFKSEGGLKQHLTKLQKRYIRKKFNRAYMDTLKTLNINLRKRKLKVIGKLENVMNAMES